MKDPFWLIMGGIFAATLLIVGLAYGFEGIGRVLPQAIAQGVVVAGLVFGIRWIWRKLFKRHH